MTKIRRSLSLGSALLAWTFAAPLAAEPVRLQYEAPAGCPNRDEFVAAVSRRGATLDDSPEGRDRWLNVAIFADGQRFRGVLEVHEGGAASEPRELRGDTCAEVLDGLAVASAIALKSDGVTAAEDSPEPEPEPKPASTEPVPPLPEAAPPATASPARKPQESARRLEEVGTFGTESVPVSEGTLTVSRDVSWSLSGGFSYGLLPDAVIPRFDLTFARANYITVPDHSKNLLIGGVLAVRWTLLGPVTYESPGFSTKVFGLRAGIGGCRPFVYDMDGAVVQFCGELGAGTMNLTTEDAAAVVTQDKTVGLGYAAFNLDTRYNLGSLLHLGLTLGGEISTSTVSAERPDGSQIFESSLFSAHALVGVGVHF